MGAELAVRDEMPQTVRLSTDQLQYIAGTEFVPPGLRGNLPAILACVATGRELGIGDMVALKSIHIIDGKATFSAELMVQLVRRRGHSITGEVSDGSATVTGTRADNGDTMTATWTTQMAERAGLLSKQNWRKYPEAMLWARAASQLCRMLFADCFAGATYTPEELEDSGPEPQAGVSTAHVSTAPTGEQPSGPGITAAQKKKADVLVGQLRDALRLTTVEVYVAAGRVVPLPAEGDVLHWSPLRDSLTKREASALIDRLETYASSEATQPPLAEWAAGSPSGGGSSPLSPEELAAELLALADAKGMRDDVAAKIEGRRAHDDDATFVRWLQAQIARAKATEQVPV